LFIIFLEHELDCVKRILIAYMYASYDAIVKLHYIALFLVIVSVNGSLK